MTKQKINKKKEFKNVEYIDGFVDVEDHTKVVKLNEEVIHMTRFFPAKTITTGNIYEKVEVTTPSGRKKIDYVKDADGNRVCSTKARNEVMLNKKWAGLCKDTKNVQWLPQAFVNDNYSQGFLEQVRSLGESKNHHFVVVPPGDDKQHTNVPKQLQSNVNIHYRQTEGLKTCMPYSFASALHHIGLRQEASEIYQYSKQICEKHNSVSLFSDYLVTVNKHLRNTLLKASEWNIFANKKHDLVLVMLRGCDGKEDHCVTVYGRYIFDSNFEKALPLSRKSLDLCCSSDSVQTKFESVVEARMFADYTSIPRKK